MADKFVSVDKIKAFWHSQFHNPEKWDLNMVYSVTLPPLSIVAHQKLLRAVGLFAGSIIIMRQYGDIMAV